MKTNMLKTLAAFTIGVLLLAACGDKNDAGGLSIHNLWHSGCSDHAVKGWENPDTLSVTYTSGTVHVVHSNLFVNCGTAMMDGGIIVTATLDGSTINIHEEEDPDNPQANCMCEVDNQFDIAGIAPGTYTLVFHNWYPEPRSFTFTF